MLVPILLLTLLQDVNVSGGELIPEQAAYDVEHYALSLEVDPEEKSIEGTLAMRATALADTRRLALDLDPRLQVRAVRVELERPLASRFEHRDGRIWIETEVPMRSGEELTLEVDYGGTPREARRPPWDGGFTWSRTQAQKPWIATSCQAEGGDLWWPCKDHPSDKPETLDLIITLPSGLFCASNGVLVSDQTSGRKRTLHWHVASPISNYNVALNIAPYEVLKKTYQSTGGEEVPVFFWHLPESRKKAKKALPEFLDHLAFMEELCGPYPFRAEKYGIAETPHLGMEHQTIIAYGNKFSGGPFGYDWLHHHELSHEWWANLVTCRDWKDVWLHEGFGTYMQALYTERERGPDGLTAHMRQIGRGLRNARAVAPRTARDARQIGFGGGASSDNDVYNKGAWVLHTLRWLMGDEPFLRALRRMAYPDPELEQVTDGSQVRFADTEDFRALAEEIHGAELGWFFELYLRQPELPRLVAEKVGRELRLRWETPIEVDFPLPVPVKAGGRIHRVPMPGGEGRLALRTSQYELDPELWLLRE